jgi:myosin heavy subunit
MPNALNNRNKNYINRTGVVTVPPIARMQTIITRLKEAAQKAGTRVNSSTQTNVTPRPPPLPPKPPPVLLNQPANARVQKLVKNNNIKKQIINLTRKLSEKNITNEQRKKKESELKAVKNELKKTVEGRVGNIKILNEFLIKSKLNNNNKIKIKNIVNKHGSNNTIISLLNRIKKKYPNATVNTANAKQNTKVNEEDTLVSAFKNLFVPINNQRINNRNSKKKRLEELKNKLKSFKNKPVPAGLRNRIEQLEREVGPKQYNTSEANAITQQVANSQVKPQKGVNSGTQTNQPVFSANTIIEITKMTDAKSKEEINKMSKAFFTRLFKLHQEKKSLQNVKNGNKMSENEARSVLLQGTNATSLSNKMKSNIKFLADSATPPSNINKQSLVGAGARHNTHTPPPVPVTYQSVMNKIKKTRVGKYASFENFKTAFMSMGGNKLKDENLNNRLRTSNMYEKEVVPKNVNKNVSIENLESNVERNLTESEENRQKRETAAQKREINTLSKPFLLNIMKTGNEQEKVRARNAFLNQNLKNEENRLEREANKLRKNTAATTIQSRVKGMQARKELEKRSEAARIIQKHVRERVHTHNPNIHQDSRLSVKTPEQTYKNLDGKVTRALYNTAVNRGKLRQEIKNFNKRQIFRLKQI